MGAVRVAYRTALWRPSPRRRRGPVPPARRARIDGEVRWSRPIDKAMDEFNLQHVALGYRAAIRNSRHVHLQRARSMTRKGSNSVRVRKYNERVVLEALRRLGTASKADLARSTNLTPRAVAVGGLVESGLVENRGRRTGLVGQPSVMFAPILTARSPSACMSDAGHSTPCWCTSPARCAGSNPPSTTIPNHAASGAWQRLTSTR